MKRGGILLIIGYLVSLILSFGLLIAYAVLVKNKEFWMTMLFCCVPAVNLGYLLLSLSKTVAFAIFSNDVAYLGSVFLCMCMFLTILRLCGFLITRRCVTVCLSLAVLMLAIVVSSPMLPLYYKSVSIETVQGAAKLVKEYGVLHPLYLVYLLGYFSAMIGAIVLSVKKKKIGRRKHAGLIAGIVCINIAVWLFEKFASQDFEFLSVSYIISEFLLLLVYWMMQDYVHMSDLSSASAERAPVIVVDSMVRAEKLEAILASLPAEVSLSARQIEILEKILEYKSRKEIALELHLSENTVKTHTGMLYKALGVSGREEIYAMLQS